MAPETMHGQALALGAQLRARRAAGPRRAGRRRAVPQRRALRPRRLRRRRAPGGGAAGRRARRSRSRCPSAWAARLGRARHAGRRHAPTPARRPRRSTGSWRPANAAPRASSLGSGGTLAALAETDGVPASPSRAAGSRAARSACCSRRCWCCSARPARRPTPADLIARGADAADAAAARDDEAHAIAQRLAGHVTVLYGSGMRAAVAVRLKNQINENAKMAAFAGACPRSRTTRSSAGCRRTRAPQQHAAVFLRDFAESRGRRDALRCDGRPIRHRDGAAVETWAAEGPDERCAGLRAAAVRRPRVVPPGGHRRASTRWTSHGSPA